MDDTGPQYQAVKKVSTISADNFTMNIELFTQTFKSVKTKFFGINTYKYGEWGNKKPDFSF
jgi:hypothetical protein